ncbi:MAG: hypothetical protein Ta2E_02360 [Mycoplasmoidaceae bacterium]|nr:MAG: hypothetical protein Ta2E_02360 [Mycoplasmoidaceae bacterium]
MKYSIVSGYFAPMHKGHLQNILDSQKFGKTIVIVNNDRQLVAKRGKSFIDEENRKFLCENVKGVKKAIIAIDKDKTVCATLSLIRKLYPNDTLTFCKGGDRTNKNTPEQEVCDKLNINIVFDIGGKKIHSSRDFLKEWGEWSRSMTEKEFNDKFNG